jgi:hypothetical protein
MIRVKFIEILLLKLVLEYILFMIPNEGLLRDLYFVDSIIALISLINWKYSPLKFAKYPVNSIDSNSDIGPIKNHRLSKYPNYCYNCPNLTFIE